MVALSRGMSNFCTVARDSPSSPRSREVASPNASSTFSFEAAVVCSSASVLPFWQFTAFNPITYSAAETGNGSRNISLTAGALAKLRRPHPESISCWIGRVISRRRLRDVTVGQNIQERRLPQRDAERGLQRIVEDGVAGAVGKIGENDRVFFGKEPASLMRTVVEHAANQRGRPARRRGQQAQSSETFEWRAGTGWHDSPRKVGPEECPLSLSRFKRCRSARISEAC